MADLELPHHRLLDSQSPEGRRLRFVKVLRRATPFPEKPLEDDGAAQNEVDLERQLFATAIERVL